MMNPKVEWFFEKDSKWRDNMNYSEQLFLIQV
jgi:hypothetical protein